jgi:hypothetical protein
MITLKNKMWNNMKNKLTKDEKILHEIYRRVYNVSKPRADWDYLLENATTNENGQKEIPFMNYECEEEVMDKILEDVLKEYKVPKYRQHLFRNSFYLGCSPKTKIKNDII